MIWEIVSLNMWKDERLTILQAVCVVFAVASDSGLSEKCTVLSFSGKQQKQAQKKLNKTYETYQLHIDSLE